MVQTLEHRSAPSVTKRDGAVNFLWHFLEMCAAMCLAWMLMLVPFVVVAKAAGTPDPVRDWPEAATLLAVVAMSAGMAVEMRWRGHGWRCIGEMTAAMVVEALVLIALAVGGILARSDEFAWYHGLMPIAMIAAMLLRLDLYTAPLGHRHEVARAVG